MIEDEAEVWSAFDATFGDWEEGQRSEPCSKWDRPSQAPANSEPSEKVQKKRSRRNTKKPHQTDQTDSLRSASVEVEDSRRRSPKRRSSREIERRARSKSARQDVTEAEKRRSRSSVRRQTSRKSRRSGPSEPTANHDSEGTGMSDAMRNRVMRRGRTSSRNPASRSASRTPSRHKRRTPVEQLSPTLACARAHSRARSRRSQRALTSRNVALQSDSESDSDVSEAEVTRKGILDVSRKGPVRALKIGRKSLDAEANTSDDEADELLLENSSKATSSLDTSISSVLRSRSLASVSNADERSVSRRLSADLSQMQMPNYYENRKSNTDGHVPTPKATRRATVEGSVPTEASLKCSESGSRESNSAVDDILKSRRLRRASASHRRGSAGGNENVGRRSSAPRSSSPALSSSEQQGNPKSLMKGFLRSFGS